MNLETYDKGELYGVLVSLTEGEAKSLLRGIHEAGFGNDKFRGLLYVNKRFGRRTQASLLQAYLEMVNPPHIKGISDIIPGIHRRENKVNALEIMQ